MICACNCGSEIGEGKSFAHGHNRRGARCSPETLAKRLATWGASSPTKGKKMSAESRARMSAAPRRKRGPMPLAQRAKIGDALRGRVSPLRKRNPGVPRDRRDYDARTREQKAARTRRWALEHPERRQINEAKRRALKKGSFGSGVSTEQWSAICEEFGGRCAYCASVRPLTLDHVDPLSKGGAHDVGNVVPACKSCNTSKLNRTIIVWLARRAA